MKILYKVTNQCIHPTLMGLDKIMYLEFNIIRKTLHGVWIKDWTRTRWVSNSAKKRFAYPTKTEALFAFSKKKECEIKILKSRLIRVKEFLEIAKRRNKNEIKS